MADDKKLPTYNSDRAYQAWQLRHHYKLTKPEYDVVQALGRLMRWESVPGDASKVVDSTFASQKTLCEETMYDDTRTISKACAGLVAKGLIRTAKLPWQKRKTRGRPKKEMWDSIIYFIVPEAWDVVEVPWRKKPATSGEKTAEAPKNSAPVAHPTAEDLAGAASIAESGPAPVQEAQIEGVSPERLQAREKVFAFLMKNYGEHPTMAHSNAKAMMRDAIDSAIDAAKGDADLVVAVLYYLSEDKGAWLRGRERLGGSLKTAFPGWLAACVNHSTNDYYLDIACREDDRRMGLVMTDEAHAVRTESILRFRLGHDLVRIERFTSDDGPAIKYEVSEAFADKWLATHPTPILVGEQQQDPEPEYAY